MGALKALIKLNTLVAQNLVAHIAQHALDLKLASAPCSSQDLPGDLLLVLCFLLISPVLTTALFHLGHFLHGHLGVNRS